jgi:hypothetical protein
MLFRDVIDLLTFSETINENGFPERTETSRETVFANKKSIRSSEFYLAAQNGYSLELMFDVRTIDFRSQKYIEFEFQKYEIVRTYENGEYTELVCQVYTDSP